MWAPFNKYIHNKIKQFNDVSYGKQYSSLQCYIGLVNVPLNYTHCPMLGTSKRPTSIFGISNVLDLQADFQLSSIDLKFSTSDDNLLITKFQSLVKFCRAELNLLAKLFQVIHTCISRNYSDTVVADIIYLHSLHSGFIIDRYVHNTSWETNLICSKDWYNT